MSSRVSIITYHYVRELARSRYPEIKGLPTSAFREQLGYIAKHYEVIDAGRLMAAVRGEEELPPRALLLTFDDGYADHFTQVFPLLDERKLPGCFFPSAMPVLEGRVLDVNKVHFILASVGDKGLLVERIRGMLDEHRAEFGLEPSDHYWRKLAQANRFDPAEVVFIKRILQTHIDGRLRARIADDLFRRHVTADEAAFSCELYMSFEQIVCLQRNGMYVGSHGYAHEWLGHLPPEEQTRDIDRSLEFLASVGSDTTRWLVCYPCGSWNDSLVAVLRARGCVAGLTTQLGVADLSRQPFALPRIDTTDLPMDAGAPANEWTLRAAAG